VSIKDVCAYSQMDEDELFAQASKCFEIGDGDWHIEEEEEEENEDDDGTKVVLLANGSWHVCLGMLCPHVRQSTDGDRCFICKLSARVVGSAMEISADSSWTGRSCTSADPDMQSSACGASWRFKRSAFSASVAAYNLARSLSSKTNGGEYVLSSFDSYNSGATAGTSVEDVSAAPSIKRGAPCVVDVDDSVVQVQKRKKAIKRIESLKQRNVQSRLLADASAVVLRLFSVTSSHSSATSASKTDHSISGGAATLLDPRLENYDFVLTMALKRYASRCQESCVKPTMSGIHDVCIAANQFVKKRQKAAKERTAPTLNQSDRRIAINGKTIELCAKLILNLWSAMCTTPYFVDHQTGDSFRPFAAGVIFAFKRGLRLPNNMILIPAIPQISNQLPTLRSSIATAGARQLQQASHRGLCAIQRGLASIDTMSDADQQLALTQLHIVTSTATRLANFVKGTQ